MSYETKNKVLICYDNGLFFDLCLKLANYFKKVYYYVPWKDSFPNMARPMIGTEWVNGKRLDTFDSLPFESIDNYFDYLPKADIAFFPDVGDGDLQLQIEEKYNIPVWGSRKAEEMETERWDTKQYFKKIGMDVQPMKRIIGMPALREHLKTVEDKWLKISKFRKNFETFHHINYYLSDPRLTEIENGMGPLSLIAEFIVEDNIEAHVEDGFDGYCVDGKFPNYSFSGTEIKNKSLAGKFSKYSDLSEGVREVNKQMSPALKSYGYRGFLSSEVRITKEGKNYAIDPCMRCASPPNEIYQEIYTNLGDIIWEGANGRLIDPIPAAQYGLEIMIHSQWYEKDHQALRFPPELRQWIKLVNPIKVDGNYYNLNTGYSPWCGAVVAIGKSLEECRGKIEKMIPQIEGYDLDIDIYEADQAIEEFNKLQTKR